MCIFKLLLSLTLTSLSVFAAGSQVVIDITPYSNLSECSPYCVTLFDYATKTLQVDNISLILQPGDHSLQSPLVVANADTFIMLSRTKDTVITCNQSGIIKFINVSTVYLLNLTFSECGNTFNAMLTFQFVHNGMIDQCSMRESKGNIIHSYKSIITITNTLLMNTTSTENGIIYLEASIMSMHCY